MLALPARSPVAIGNFTNTAVSNITTNDPLTQYLDWSGVHILKARAVTLPTWARVLVEAEGGPLVFAGETGGRRIAVLTFDLHDSDGRSRTRFADVEHLAARVERVPFKDRVRHANFVPSEVRQRVLG